MVATGVLEVVVVVSVVHCCQGVWVVVATGVLEVVVVVVVEVFHCSQLLPEC